MLVKRTLLSLHTPIQAIGMCIVMPVRYGPYLRAPCLPCLQGVPRLFQRKSEMTSQPRCNLARGKKRSAWTAWHGMQKGGALRSKVAYNRFLQANYWIEVWL